MLTIKTTHLKEGYLRRNGLPRSDKATLTEHWVRNGNFLTVMTIINDPVYLTEPMVRTTDYELDVNQQIPPYPCSVVEEIDREKGVIPHHLPGTNPYLTEFAKKYNLPVEATRGGAETMYPEYRDKMKAAQQTTSGGVAMIGRQPATTVAVLLVVLGPSVSAQQPPPTPRSAAPIDLTGSWVSSSPRIGGGGCVRRRRVITRAYR